MQTKTNLQQILNVFEMATEEQKIELTNNPEELKERVKTESPAELLQSSLIGLDKYGGFIYCNFFEQFLNCHIKIYN